MGAGVAVLNRVLFIVCMCVHMCDTASVWRSENYFGDVSTHFYLVWGRVSTLLDATFYQASSTEGF